VPAELSETLAAAFAVEYRKIVDAGFRLQIDLPEITAKHWGAPDLPLAQWRDLLAPAWDICAGRSPASIRIWSESTSAGGTTRGPRDRDLPVGDVVDLVYENDANGISLEAANPRHQHESKVIEALPLPDGKYVIPGVIDTCAMHVEDPEVVAQRIERYASVVGRERIIAGADCGFGTPAGQDNLRPSVVWSKLASLSEGARLASRRRCSPTVNLRLD
jgi:5-methyltetrahydropteroyltriglutamate--homocysteine methyltransferase